MAKESMIDRAIQGSAPPISYRKGGRIRKKGTIRVHAGEVVLPKKEVKRLEKLIHSKKRGKK